MSSSGLAGPWGAVAAAVLGVVLGRLLTLLTGGWLASCERELAHEQPGPRATDPSRAIELAAVAVAVALWWWEVHQSGQAPLDGKGGQLSLPAGELACRYGAHLTLFWLLAAATWIDFRYRVIPDWITLPGLLVALVAVWLVPGILLPVAAEIPRSFALSLYSPDVLGWAGPLRFMVAQGGWESPRTVAALAISVGIYAAWWWACTAPGSGPAVPWWRSSRGAVLLAGLVAILAAWTHGGDRFAGLFSGLIGVIVSGGLVWAIRCGATWALGREAMGMGDVTLMAMVGAWLGWQSCVVAFFLAAFIGLGHGMWQIALHRESELPFGPSLCLASAAVVIGWGPLWDRIGPLFADPLLMAAGVAAVVVLTAITLFLWRLVRPLLAGGG